ncbi:MAG TPA: hypothetical protein VN903_00020 [Polyangia bacterium]|jgi:hypothetical protein|nr:hypothetical protein [Polyangia bacterium]
MNIDARIRATIAGFATAVALLALLAIGGSGCGGGSSSMTSPDNTGDPGTPQVTTGPYQPLTVGTTWTYHVDDQGTTYDKQSAVEAFEDMGGDIAGTMGYRVRETIKASIQLTWYEQTATDVRRHHDTLSDTTGRMLSDEWYAPYLLRVDEAPDHLQAGATWTINYTKTKTTASKPTAMTNQAETWKVDAVDIVAAVPAGTFNALKITRTDTSDGSTKTQWFVRGVGKVRELTGAGHKEELTAYTIAP